MVMGDEWWVILMSVDWLIVMGDERWVLIDEWLVMSDWWRGMGDEWWVIDGNGWWVMGWNG